MNKIGKFTGFYDDFNNPIYVGQTLASKYGYKIIVYEEDGDFFGRLICGQNHSCKNIPYALNKGNGYIILK